MKRALSLLVVGPLLVLLIGASEAHDPRYRAQGDGTVKDTRFGLTWLAHANCWGALTWEEAKTEVAALQDGSCGLTDGSQPGEWRLPTKEEWEGMVECSCGDIALSDDLGTGCYASGDSAFHDVQASDYWSSTRSASGGTIRVMSLSGGIDSGTAAEVLLPVWAIRN